MSATPIQIDGRELGTPRSGAVLLRIDPLLLLAGVGLVALLGR